MRQVLLRIPLNYTITLPGLAQPILVMHLMCVVWVAFCAFWAYKHFRRRGFDSDLQGQLIFEGIVAVLLWMLPQWVTSQPIYGYGASMVAGFLVAAYLAGIRAKREGLDPSAIMDVGLAVLIGGVVGARLFWVFQNAAAIFKPGRKIGAVAFDIVNLPNGGLVLYGGVMLGIVAYVVKCRQLKLNYLRVADIVISSIFIGEMFGRIGCFLNGCCWGDVAPPGWHSPWAVQFPPSSAAYQSELINQVIPKGAVCSLPLLPTQLYSSLNALFLAILTWFYYPHRTRNGEVLCLGWLLYPISRFFIEIVRDEPPGLLNFPARNPMSIAQEISILLFVTGLAFAYYLSTQPPLNRSKATP